MERICGGKRRHCYIVNRIVEPCQFGPAGPVPAPPTALVVTPNGTLCLATYPARLSPHGIAGPPKSPPNFRRNPVFARLTLVFAT